MATITEPVDPFAKRNYTGMFSPYQTFHVTRSERDVARGTVIKLYQARLLRCPYQRPYPRPTNALLGAAFECHPLTLIDDRTLRSLPWQTIRERLGIV